MGDGSRDPTAGPGRAGPATGGGSGVLGNLPRSRPAVRSPRRVTPAGDEAMEGKPGEESMAKPEGAAPSSPADIEALARGGLALAGGAASLGLRLAGQAAAAVRGAVERR